MKNKRKEEIPRSEGRVSDELSPNEREGGGS